MYNLAAQSHVGVSFEVPEYTADVSGIGTIRLLDAIRILININFIRPLPQNFMESERSSTKRNNSILSTSPYGVAKFMHIGSPKIIENHITCLQLTESFLIMNLRVEEKHL